MSSPTLLHVSCRRPVGLSCSWQGQSRTPTPAPASGRRRGQQWCRSRLPRGGQTLLLCCIWFLHPSSITCSQRRSSKLFSHLSLTLPPLLSLPLHPMCQKCESCNKCKNMKSKQSRTTEKKAKFLCKHNRKKEIF